MREEGASGARDRRVAHHTRTDESLITHGPTSRSSHTSGRVSRGGRGDLRLTVANLAALYANYLTPREMVRQGWLELGEDPSALESAQTFFGFKGTAPWMPDHF